MCTKLVDDLTKKEHSSLVYVYLCWRTRRPKYHRNCSELCCARLCLSEKASIADDGDGLANQFLQLLCRHTTNLHKTITPSITDLLFDGLVYSAAREFWSKIDCHTSPPETREGHSTSHKPVEGFVNVGAVTAARENVIPGGVPVVVLAAAQRIRVQLRLVAVVSDVTRVRRKVRVHGDIMPTPR